MRTLSTLIAITLLFAACAAPSWADNWTRFRGPNGSGISHAKTVPVEWTEDGVNWVAELPGEGHSSPVIWEDRLFVTSADKKTGARYLVCINTADGSTRWQSTFNLGAQRAHKNNSLASGTPTVDDQHVYVLWQTPESSPLVALDHEGQQIWSYDLGPYLHGQGPGTSPILYQNMVIVCNDHKQGSFLLAVDRQSGRVIWKTEREGKRACYATPCVFEPADRPAELVFSHCFEGITGVDPQTGRQKWMIAPFGTFAQRAVGSPIVAGDLVIANSGAISGEKNVVAVRTVADRSAESEGIQAEEVYRITKSAPHVTSVLAYQGLLFLWNDRGVVTCVRAETGEMVWQKRVGGNYFGSPICIDGRLYCVDQEGTVAVVEASDKFQVLARNALGKPSRSTPAVANGTLYIRTFSHITSIGG